ncbi:MULTISPECIES: amidase [unclassified Streptomyces]|uniref:amidase n=1 Tax=unclassified Streptomyces TaxID=2593676 RepID=UPI000DC77D11|nr:MULTISPECIES: amidase [unclassified Streptomyces]AWZ08209.1 amidase [Streptomyces sp. ICC4]AWZ16012.1 amidase [Streptomyces sp. ICC1]
MTNFDEQAIVHAFRDDALGEHDAVGLAAAIRRGDVSPAEAARDAGERVRAVDARLRAVQVHVDGPAHPAGTGGAFAGVPTFVKDNTDYQGLPTGHGSAAFRPRSAARHAPFTRQFLSSGVTVLGKTRLPEFGFSPTTEYDGAEPVRNPWHTGYSAGGSSGGSAALVAAGAVPIAHANDGGGSIRIPAACCGLVGLKPSRGRVVGSALSRPLPIDIISDGIVSRSVRDAAAFLAAAESYRRSPELAPVGLVEGPSERRLRIGFVLDSPNGVHSDASTRAAVLETAATLGRLGHTVEPVELGMDPSFTDDFLTYWGMMSFLLGVTGRTLGADFDRRRMDGLSQGLREEYLRNWRRTPGVVRRLKRTKEAYAASFRGLDLVMSPVLAHTTPPIGHLSPAVPYAKLIERILAYVAFTPVDNVVGTPSISVPAASTTDGLPIGVMFAARPGGERKLLEIAFELEADRPFRRIQDQ